MRVAVAVVNTCACAPFVFGSCAGSIDLPLRLHDSTAAQPRAASAAHFAHCFALCRIDCAVQLSGVVPDGALYADAQGNEIG